MRSGSASDAARILNRTQPAVSALIANLESELGLTLFRRQKGRMVPTPEAQFFLNDAESILDRLALSTRTMHEIGNLTKGRLNIACMPAAADMLMPQLLGDFLQGRPQVDASLMMRASSVVTEWVASQQYDIGLAETSAANPGIQTRDFKLECLCAIPRHDPLAQKEFIEARDLNAKPMAALQGGHPNLIATQAAFAKQRAKFVHRFELRTFQPALMMVERSLCYCICDPISAAGYARLAPEPRPVVFRPFHPGVFLEVSILQPAHRPASVLATEFAERLSHELERLEKHV